MSKLPNKMSRISTTRYRPTWIEVDLNAIKHNFLKIRKSVSKDTAILVPVKANAYGHGIFEVATELVASGVDYLGVGTTDEGVLLRKKGFKVGILMLGSIISLEIEAIVKYNITQAVGDIELARKINNYCKKYGKRQKVHIEIDIGMGRIGIWHEDAIDLIKAISKLKYIDVDGVFTHFSSADEDETLTNKQIDDFKRLIDKIEDNNLDIRYKHMANSTASIDYKRSHLNFIRPGLMVYGLYPKGVKSNSKIYLKPALSLKSRVVFIKEVPPGRRISYGGTYTTKSHTDVATIPIGYGDGLNRNLSNIGSVLINKKRAPIVGRICMDQIMVDLGKDSKVKIADEVVLIGSQGLKTISIEEIAETSKTIPYEVACWFDKRIPYKYIVIKK